jgi:hypothetical protein
MEAVKTVEAVPHKKGGRGALWSNKVLSQLHCTVSTPDWSTL